MTSPLCLLLPPTGVPLAVEVMLAGVVSDSTNAAVSDCSSASS